MARGDTGVMEGWGDADPAWTLPSRLADNPRAWMVSMDAHSLSRDHQVPLHEAGLTPLVHADQGIAARDRGDDV
jgi:hypothetical protein